LRKTMRSRTPVSEELEAGAATDAPR